MLIAFGLTILGVGFWNNTAALVVLAIPPILTNAYFAIDGVDRDVVEAARGMGMSERQVLARGRAAARTAASSIAGIRIAAIFVLATATIAAVAGGGGLGEIIVDQASYGLAGVVAGALCVSALTLLAAFSSACCAGFCRLALSRRRRLRASAHYPEEDSMYRKHTRRAAKAAYAISLGVALLIGLIACGGGREQRRRPRSRP